MKSTIATKAGQRRFAQRLFATVAGSALLAVTVSSAFGQAANEPYLLGNGDVLAINVFGEEGLSGEFTINDGAIAYPLLGQVVVSGKSTADVADALSRDLAEFVPGLSVAAAVSRYAPVFVLGDVQTPGRYDYRPGMITLELFALGGGLRRAETPLASGSGLQLLGMRQELNDNELQIMGLEAARARHRAELDDGDFIPPEPRKDEPALLAFQRKVNERERDLLTIRNANLEAEGKALLAQEQSFVDEIASITQSIKLHEDEIRLLGEDVAATTQLVERGLTSKSNLRESERRLSATRRDALELNSYLARARQNLLAVQQRREGLKEQRRNEAAAKLQEVELELERKAKREEALLASMVEVAMTADSGAQLQAGVTLSYRILRRTPEGDYEETPVGEREQIRPGDILRAEMVRPVATSANTN
ncbi:polysaccharide biosynthesis/export family protein [Neoaquamicrobium sediminum]|uniref:Polysaccharide biosynthesis/export family protein n=1 Tax=Neoaquamicrobium sediminum TaxID=1849104 RepID=A0ABV3WWB6_9HYPH